MICEPCKAGARLLVESRALPVERQWVMRTLAFDKHKDCTAPATCPCHHKIGARDAIIQD